MKKELFGGLPSERADGEIVVSPLPDSKLGREIIKAEKAVGGVEFFWISASHIQDQLDPLCCMLVGGAGGRWERSAMDWSMASYRLR